MKSLMRRTFVAAALLLPLFGARLVFAASSTVVTLGFDDGSADQMIANRLLNERGLKGVFFINSQELGTSGYYMTKANVDAIFASGHEIAGHTLTHPHLPTLTQSQMQHEICDDRAQLNAWGYSVANFAYPFGEYNNTVKSVAQSCGYTSGRGVGGNREAIPPPDMFALKTPNSIQPTDSLAAIQAYVTNVENSGGGWVNLVFHHICSNCGDYSVSESTLASFLDWLKNRPSTTVVRTEKEVLGGGGPPLSSPSIASLSPASATAGSPAFTLTINGSAFVSGAGAQWNGSNRTTTFVNAGQLRAAITAADIAFAGTADVSVRNPDGGVSASRSFTVNASTTPPPPPPPAPGGALFSETFTYPNGLITNANTASVRSSTWNVYGGSLFANAQQGWTGVPDTVSPNATSSNGTGSVYFRSVTNRTNFGDVSVYLKAINQGFVAPTGSPAQPWDAVMIPLRWQSDANYYYFSLRRDNTVQLKKRIGGTESTLVSTSFTTPINTTLNLQADAQTQGSAVMLRLFIDGTQRLTFTDTAANSLKSGAVGFNGDNVNFRVDDFTVMPFGVAPSTGPAGAPMPALASISPSSATAGGPTFTLIATGTSFTPSSIVRFNGHDMPSTTIGTTRIDAQISSNEILSAGSVPVVVFTPAPGGGVSNALTFTINPAAASNPVPAIASISPSSATAGSPARTVTVDGSNFVSSSTVRWDGANRATTFVDAGRLTAAITAADLSAPTTAQVTVFNPAPGGGVSNAAAFVVHSATAPPPPPGALFADNFNRANQLITNEFAFYNPTDSASVQSTTWTVTAGSLFINSNTAWTGVPDSNDPNATSSNATGSAVFRAQTKRVDYGSVSVDFKLTNQGFVTTPATPAQSYDGVRLGLRYLNESNFYELSFNRRDNTAVIKKVRSGTLTQLAAASYAVPINVVQNAQATILTNANGSVTIAIKFNGATVVTATDASTPLTLAGAVSFRSGNVNFRFDDLVIQQLTGTGPAGLAALQDSPAIIVAPAAGSLDTLRVFPNPWRADRHGSAGITIDGLPPQSEVRIYTVAGEWIRTISAPNGVGAWDLTNSSGGRVASGVYLYVVTDNGGSRRRGVVAVVR